MSEASGSRPKPNKKNGKTQKKLSGAKMKRLTEKQQIEALEKRAMTFEPPSDLSQFSDLPISDHTKRGLKKASFVKMTEIQAKSLPVSLKGKDMLGAARTGSGKTLAFLIPVLEMLYRKKWGPMDGLGALIVSPTRELAVQIFEVLRSIGPYHSFSAGLVIGGKNLKDESERLSRMNILVATPGRLLQHLDQAVGFDAGNLQVLVLDEADRILDMGFKRTLAALLGHLPKTRQTLLFSATQTESVSDLARLSLKDPVYVGVKDAGASNSFIPDNLEQHYIVTELDKKLDVLWSFIKTHLQSKILVFMSSCKQVRFVYETFCKMHPGMPLIHLHGKLKQQARLQMYTKFTSQSHAVLFATDIAARGLDFPGVDWVVQIDAPEDAETYIHRVGRTARYESHGKALLFLLPTEEEGMVAALKKKGLEVNKIKIRSSKTQSIENQLQKLCFEDPEIKYLAQRSFVSYLRSIYLHKDKSIFKLEGLPVDRYAESLGLPGTPKIKFFSRELAKQKKNASREVQAIEKGDETSSEEEEEGSESEGEDGSGDEENAKEAKDAKGDVVRTKYDRMFGRKNQNVLSAHYTKLIDHDGFGNENDPDEEDFITLKRVDHELPDSIPPIDPNDASELSKRKLKMSKTKRQIAKSGSNKKLIFDDEGKPHELYELADGKEWIEGQGGLEGVQQEGRKFAEEERSKKEVTDVLDKAQAKAKKQEKKRKRKERENMLAGDMGAGGTATLGGVSDDDDGYQSPEFDLPSGSDSEDEAATFEEYQQKRSMAQRQLPPAKKRKTDHALEDEEELALQLLKRSLEALDKSHFYAYHAGALFRDYLRLDSLVIPEKFAIFGIYQHRHIGHLRQCFRLRHAMLKAYLHRERCTMFQYPYSHSTYFTRTTDDDLTSELPPMNSMEDILQIQFMHDRMMAHDEGEKHVRWQRISRLTRDIKRGFRSSLQAIAPSRKSGRRISVVSNKSRDDFKSAFP